MKIEQIELHHLRMRLKRPFRTSFGVEHDRECVLVQVRGDGVEGWGECPAGSKPDYSYETVGSALHVMEVFFAPALMGLEVASPPDAMSNLSGFRGHPMARAGLEMALWDLHGKQTGQSLAQMIGAGRERVEVGVSVGIQPDLTALVQVVEAHLEEGYRRIKLKIEPGRDLEDIAAVRGRYPALRLQVDANAAYALGDADVFRQLDDFDLLLIEQPLAEGDLIDHSRLQALVNTPLCLDESILSRRDARQALEIDACRVINIKQGRVGGLTEALAIHDLCLHRGAPVWCGGLLETGVGRAANLALAAKEGFTLPGDISATDRYYDRDIAEPRFQLNPDSSIDVPQLPGLGIEIDARELERATVARRLLAPG